MTLWMHNPCDLQEPHTSKGPWLKLIFSCCHCNILNRLLDQRPPWIHFTHGIVNLAKSSDSAQGNVWNYIWSNIFFFFTDLVSYLERCFGDAGKSMPVMCLLNVVLAKMALCESEWTNLSTYLPVTHFPRKRNLPDSCNKGTRVENQQYWLQNYLFSLLKGLRKTRGFILPVIKGNFEKWVLK